MGSIRKREGFEGQRAIVLPRKIIEMCKNTSPVNGLFVTDIGFYPHASFHYRERPTGVAQNILIYCVEGRGWLELPSGTFSVGPNEFLIIPSDMPHIYGAAENSPWSIYWAHFTGTQASHFAALLSKQHTSYVSYSPFLEERTQVFDSIYKSLETGYSTDNLLYASVAFGYFLGLLLHPDKYASAQHSTEKDVVGMSIEFMQKNLESPLRLEVLASAINLSVSQYSAVFRKKTGYSPIEYFNHLKIQRACQYLQFTTLRISEISEKLGISDAYYFSRMFTKMMGVSPMEYRNKKR